MIKTLSKVPSSVCIAYATGCVRNITETTLLYEYFQANGWKIKRRFEDADLVLVATCGFDNNREEYSIKLLSIVDAKRKNNSKLVVIGCLAGINQSRIQSNFDAITVAPVELDRLDEIINAKFKLREVRDLNYVNPCTRKTAWYCFRSAERRENTGRIKAAIKDTVPYIYSVLMSLGLERASLSTVSTITKMLGYKGPTALEPFGNVYNLRVCHGCSSQCSYCAIRFAVGPLRSRPLEKISAEFETALDKRFSDFHIIAADTGAYGQDIGTNVVELFRMLFEKKGKFKLTITDFNPEWLIAYSDELIKLFKANSHKIHFLSFPIQSGSDRILSLMRRKYTAQKAKECLYRLREECPKIYLATHVMVGFPTETEDDFEQTAQLLTDVRFDRTDIYRYNSRPNTPANQIEDDVPEETIENRVRRLQEQFPLASYR